MYASTLHSIWITKSSKTTGTFSQIYIQLVFSGKDRERLIDRKWEEELYKYIRGIIRNKGQKLIAINGVPDYIQILIGMKPSCRPSDLIREDKTLY
ncbi:MAG: hypothetical protein Sapg2KO_15650 [Saprospiraceae bacterium]